MSNLINKQGTHLQYKSNASKVSNRPNVRKGSIVSKITESLVSMKMNLGLQIAALMDLMDGELSEEKKGITKLEKEIIDNFKGKSEKEMQEKLDRMQSRFNLL